MGTQPVLILFVRSIPITKHNLYVRNEMPMEITSHDVAGITLNNFSNILFSPGIKWSVIGK